MKKLFFALAIIVMALPLSAQKRLEVGVFAGHGGAETCVEETYAALLMDRSITPHYLYSRDIATGALDRLDVLILPGGGGSTEYLNFGGLGAERIRRFVRQGGGIVGICAGAYELTDTPDYACLRMSGAKAIDIEHDTRGLAVSMVTLTPEGRTAFPELATRDTLYIMYYEGPVLVPDDKGEITYTSLATMESDVHEYGVPGGVTNGKPFIITGSYGAGKTLSVIGHPENTAGMQWMIPRMAHLVASSEIPEQIDRKFIDPDHFGREIKMNEERRQYESDAYDLLLYAAPEKKVEVLDTLMKMNSWSAKGWIQGLLYDESPLVRAAAVHWLGETTYLRYRDDLRALRSCETDPVVRQAVENALRQMEP